VWNYCGIIAKRMSTTTMQHLARVVARRAEGQSREADRLTALLPAIVRLLVERYGVRRVVLFGSLATGDLSGDLDIDLAVEGLDPAAHWAATTAAARLAGADVDLIPLEDADARLQGVIRREGRPLHG
jgi:hypothetical protein